jgi:hypothetical protein
MARQQPSQYVIPWIGPGVKCILNWRNSQYIDFAQDIADSTNIWGKWDSIHPTALCECGLGEQIPEHILQTSPNMSNRQHSWPEPTALKTKLWGTADDLRKTTNFVKYHGLRIWFGHDWTQKKKWRSIPGRPEWFLETRNSVWPKLTLDSACFPNNDIRLLTPLCRVKSFITWKMHEIIFDDGHNTHKAIF